MFLSVVSSSVRSSATAAVAAAGEDSVGGGTARPLSSSMSSAQVCKNRLFLDDGTETNLAESWQQNHQFLPYTEATWLAEYLFVIIAASHMMHPPLLSDLFPRRQLVAEQANVPKGGRFHPGQWRKHRLLEYWSCCQVRAFCINVSHTPALLPIF
jgi:hypothetical protein